MTTSWSLKEKNTFDYDLLLESGDVLLQENGDHILTEASVADWVSPTKGTLTDFFLQIGDGYNLLIESPYRLIIGSGTFAWSDISKTSTTWSSSQKN
jgi:hypothetical protein